MTPEEHERLLDGPALTPPPNVQPQIGHAPSLETEGFVLTITLLVIIFLLFSVRMFVKIRIAGQVALEDYLLLFSWVAFSGGFTVVALLVAKKNVGAHQWDLTVRELIDYLKTFHAGSVLYNVIILPLKISITLQMLRFFAPAGVRNFTFWMSHILIWVNTLFYVTCTLLLIFACKPEAKIYDPTIEGGHCLDSAAILISTAVLNSVSDALMLILPQRVIWDLSMPVKRKIGLSAAFLIALLAFASSIVRLYFALQLKKSHDMSYNIGWLGMWTLPEITIAFLISCLPFVPKFVRYMAQKPLISKMMVRMHSILRSASEKSRHYSRAGYPGTSQIPRHGRPSRIISDVEFDELVARTGLSSTGRLENEGHGPVLWTHREDEHSNEWPLDNDAHTAMVWTAKDASTQTSVASEPDGIVVTTNVSVSRE